jgi:transposase
MRGSPDELFSNPASAAWSRKAAQRAGFVNNSSGLGRCSIWSQNAEADTPRPATTRSLLTYDVCPETVGRDESAAQPNESADASKLNGLPISLSPAGTPPVFATPMTTTPTYAAFVGLDWADRFHQVCLRAADSEREEQNKLQHDPLALHSWAQGLRARFPQGKIAVALEQTKGPLIYALSQHEHLELYPLNPAMLAKYREAAKAASGAKSDPLDASLACELVRIHRDWLRPLPALPAEVRELQMLLEARRGLVDQRTGLCNQLTAALKGYYPQALQLVGDDIGGPMARAFLRRWPTLQAAQRARADALRRFYQGHHVRSVERIAERLIVLRTAVPLTQDPAVLATLPLTVAVVLGQLAVLEPAIAEYDRRIAASFARQTDAFLFTALPGAGAQLAPRLLVAFGPDRSRYASARELQQYSGVAPVQKQSGKTKITQWRWHCPKFLRQSFHEFAGCSIPHSRWARAYYQYHTEHGKPHHRVVRALAFKWQRILFRCWQTGEPYDEERYLAALRRRGSPLIARLDALSAQAA